MYEMGKRSVDQHTTVYGASSTCLSQPIALTHGATEADVHELLGVIRHGGATRHHETYATSQQASDLLEYCPVITE